jgi:hypothetical protein
VVKARYKECGESLPWNMVGWYGWRQLQVRGNSGVCGQIKMVFRELLIKGDYVAQRFASLWGYRSA